MNAHIVNNYYAYSVTVRDFKTLKLIHHQTKIPKGASQIHGGQMLPLKETLTDIGFKKIALIVKDVKLRSVAVSVNFLLYKARV